MLVQPDEELERRRTRRMVWVALRAGVSFLVLYLVTRHDWPLAFAIATGIILGDVVGSTLVALLELPYDLWTSNTQMLVNAAFVAVAAWQTPVFSSLDRPEVYGPAAMPALVVAIARVTRWYMKYFSD